MVSYLQRTSVFRGITGDRKDLQPSLLKLPRCLALFLPLLLSSAVYAQSNYASLSGTVVDPDQKIVPAAVVTLTALSTHATLVRNNFGGSVSGPIARNRTFFFANYEGLRHIKADTMIDTAPTADEVNGDFSMSGVTIYNPFSSHPNPGFNPSKPVSPTNPQIIRDPFPNNQIPANLIDPKAQLFLTK